MYKPTPKERQQSFGLCLDYLRTREVPKDLREDTKIYIIGDLLEKIIQYNKTHTPPKFHYITFDKIMSPKTLYEFYIVHLLQSYATTGQWVYSLGDMEKQILKYAVMQTFTMLNGAGCREFMDGSTRISIPWENSSHVTQLYNGVEVITKEGLEFITFCTGKRVEWDALKPLVKQAVIDVTTRVKEEGHVGRMLNTQLLQLQLIKHKLQQLILEERCKVFLGLAGSGKSTAACYGLTGQWLGISLCNTVALELYHKNNCITPLSIAAYKCYQRAKGDVAATIRATPNIILDETSLWTANELDALATIVIQVVDNDGKLYILGDMHQQHGFLGRGCLLDAIIKLAKETNEASISNHTTLYRQASIPEHQRRLMTYIKTGRISDLGGVTQGLDYNKIAIKMIRDLKNSIVIALTNKSVTYINRICISKLAGCTDGETQSLLKMSEAEFKAWLLDNLELFKDYDIPLIGAKTQLMAKPPKGCGIIERFNYKVLRNEKAWLSNGMVRREITGTKTFYDNPFEYFDLGFAITCFRSQGLEWNNTYVVLENPMLFRYESVYVAESRCRQTIDTYYGNASYKDRVLQPIQMLNAFDIEVIH